MVICPRQRNEEMRRAAQVTELVHWGGRGCSEAVSPTTVPPAHCTPCPLPATIETLKSGAVS